MVQEDHDSEIKRDFEGTSKHEVDSKFAWLMILAASMIHFIIFGTFSIFGVYLAEYIKVDFSDVSSTLMSLIGGVGPAVFAIFSVPSGLLFAKVGHKTNLFSGAILFTGGLIAASFATQVWHLFIGQALLLGVAVSLCFIPAITIATQWLDKYRGLGLGLCAAGSGVGGLVFAPLIQAIIDSIGWRWALRINGIIGFVGLVACGLIIRPRAAFESPKKILDTDLITDYKFIAMWLQGAASCFGFWVPFFIMPLYCKTFDITPSTASLIVGLMNGFNALGRLAMGKVADFIGNINTLLISNLICSLSFLVIWYFSTTTWSLILFSLVYGIFSGAFFTNSALLAPELFGIEKLAQVNGLFYTCCAPGYLVGTVIATAIVNAYTDGSQVNYLPTMFYLFACFFSSCLFCLWLRVLVTKKLTAKV